MPRHVSAGLRFKGKCCRPSSRSEPRVPSNRLSATSLSSPASGKWASQPHELTEDNGVWPSTEPSAGLLRTRESTENGWICRDCGIRSAIPVETSYDYRLRPVIDAGNVARNHYKSIIRTTDGEEYVTQDLCVRLLADEEGHRVLVDGYLKENTKNAA